MADTRGPEEPTAEEDVYKRQCMAYSTGVGRALDLLGVIVGAPAPGQ